jgi:penicillin-binding protein 1C
MNLGAILQWYRKHKKISISVIVLAVAFLLFLLIPLPKFTNPYSLVLVSKDGELLGAKVADDGQWRFAARNQYSEKYIRCLLSFEDHYFFLHPGINPVAFVKAAVANAKAGEIVSGGSTISMQVIRMARGNRERTYCEKLLEVLLALRLELRYSKKEILDLYAANAPFGGNVVGIEAASWRYFNTLPEHLTWAEAATLAVLPNSPALVHPGRGRERLKLKRDNLLKSMLSINCHLPKKYRSELFTDEDADLAVMEEIPSRPFDMPSLAYHYMMDNDNAQNGPYIKSTIDFDLQQYINQVVNKHYDANEANRIENYAVYVLDYLNQNTVAYVGNCMKAKDAAMVNMVKAQRSTGSILKPFLFAAMLDEGSLLPDMVLPDVPVNISGYTPRNYSGNYWGAVKASEALTNSLNTPFVYLLRKYGYQRFHFLLKRLSLSGITKGADHYGLSIILGGAEASLFDIVNAYGKMGLKLSNALHPTIDELSEDGSVPFSAEAIAETFDVMQNLNRPINQLGWKNFASSKRVAWKTGTSFGFKDAWAVGVTDRYVVGVWCGNSNGEGRAGLSGINTAAPIMFDVLAQIKDSYSYPSTTADAIEVEVCAVSGYPKSEFCPETKIIHQLNVDNKTGVCPYHKKIFLDQTSQYQVFANCYDVDKNNYAIYYVLPPVMEWFYKRHSPIYRPLPPSLPGCSNQQADEIMSFIYPESSIRLTIPIGIQGDRQQVVFEIAHRNPEKTIYWTLDDEFLGKTSRVHQMAIDVEKGVYLLRCVDEDANVITRKIIVN